MKKLIVASLILAFVASPAAAQTAGSLDGFKLTALGGVDIGGDRDKEGIGGSLGYDRSVGSMVLGVELGGVGHAHLAGRVGIPVGTNAMLVGKAGLAGSDIKLRNATGAVIDEVEVRGALLGVGAEVGLGRKLFLTTGYHYTNFEAGLKIHQIVGGLGFRF